MHQVVECFQLPSIAILLAVFLWGHGSVTRAAEESSSSIDFARDVFPILRRSCLDCHGPSRQEGGLRLDDRESAEWTVRGDVAESELLRRVVLPEDNEQRMPARGAPLVAEQIAVLRNWVEQGAAWPDELEPASHWSFAAPTRPALPPVRETSWPRQALDYFVLAELERRDLRPSPAADRAVWLRRVYLDLTGIPPSPADVAAYLADERDDADQRVVDRLLASPHFGERWARPWLDLARYADSHGFQRDDLRQIWAYRDWVIRALNDDMPFDQFTIEQFAGDLLPDATASQRIATGFHRSTTINVEAGTEPEESRFHQVVDRVNTMGAVWLGMTLECAQCHDHKYDPISQREYYQLFAYLNQTLIEADRANPNNPGSIRFLDPGMPLANPELEARRKAVQAELDATADSEEEDDVRRRAELQGKLESLRPDTTLVMQELDEPRPTFLYSTGDYASPAEPVDPGTPRILHALPPGPANRLTLARWLVDSRNPLTARVTVNRWWRELFGRGLVATVEDFGMQGEPPTHPELLDWLAVEMMDRGWSMKQWLREVVLSSTYRQSSDGSAEQWRLDDQNRLLARGPRFRMDAEMIRDNALAITGLLSHKQEGPPIRPEQPEDLWSKIGGDKVDYVVSPGEDRHRRGVYVVWKRSAPYPSFVNFDATARLTCVVRRSRANTPLQALTLLNDPVYIEAAHAFARRVLHESTSESLEKRLEHAWQLAVARRPQPAELAALERLYQQQLGDHASRTSCPDSHQSAADEFDISLAEYSAWLAVATTLLNLDETITKR
jgi:hypothetical protein